MALIETDDDYRAFLLVVEKLMDGDPMPDTPQGQSLNFLADIVEKYEKERFSNLMGHKK